MEHQKRLVAWIGYHDLSAMGQALGGATYADVVAAIGQLRTAQNEFGPIRTLTSQVDFQRIHLLSDYESHPEKYGDSIASVIRRFSAWIGPKAQVHPVQLRDPTSYEDVFKVSDGVLSEIRKGFDAEKERLCIHLSPGTPTMAAVWVLLAKTRFPATLYQTHRGQVREETIPFDIQLDYLPELLKEPDRSLELLASSSPSELEGFEELIGQSNALRLAVGRARRAAIRDVNVLILGESGTGKEMIARAMHRASHRGRDDAKYKRFVAINCAAIPRELLEGELFGVEEGAATDTRKRQGAFELADKGTLFLDEVGECSLDHQAKLLRALQPRPGEPPCRRWIRRVGGEAEKTFDVRIIAATNRNLIETLSLGGFRDDLYYRLATVTVELPSLRERTSDIPLLANDILGRINREFASTEPGYENKVLTAPAMRRLREHHWLGNIRELNNVLVQAAVMAVGKEIGRRDIDAAIVQRPASSLQGAFSRKRGDGFDLPRRLREIEAVFIADALEDADNNQTRAAKLLGISQQALSKKLQQSRSSKWYRM